MVQEVQEKRNTVKRKECNEKTYTQHPVGSLYVSDVRTGDGIGRGPSATGQQH